jgi:hypothetical protein
MTDSDMPGDPNGPAFTTREFREGVPLDYVGEKMERAMKGLHEAWKLTDSIPESAILWPGAPFETTVRSRMKYEIRHAFRQQLVSLLALSNLLALTAREEELLDRLLGYNRDQLRQWLDHIYHGGQASEKERPGGDDGSP